VRDVSVAPQIPLGNMLQTESFNILYQGQLRQE